MEEYTSDAYEKSDDDMPSSVELKFAKKAVCQRRASLFPNVLSQTRRARRKAHYAYSSKTSRIMPYISR